MPVPPLRPDLHQLVEQMLTEWEYLDQVQAKRKFRPMLAKLDAALSAAPQETKLMVHCEECGGFAHFGLDAFDGMESGTILPPCEECGKRMTVLLCKDGEYQRYLAAPDTKE